MQVYRPARSGGGARVLLGLAVALVIAPTLTLSILAKGAAVIVPAITASIQVPDVVRPARPHRAGRTAAVCPVKGGAEFSDTWGACRDGCRRSHKGVDMFAPAGTPLVAVTSGRVIRAGWNRLGGLGVTIRDPAGTEFYYAHNSHNAVRAGDPVRRGQLVGRVGNTGNARHTPSHVHFEVRPGGRTVNPTPFVRRWCR